MSHNITVEGGTSVRLPTAGKYCDRDIVVTALGGAVAKPIIKPLEVIENGTYTAQSGVDGYSPITVNVEASGNTDLEDALITHKISLAEYSNDRVTSVGYGTFYGNTNMAKISVPNVKSIDGYAFYKCTSLTTFDAPLLTSVGTYAFSYTKLSSIYFPALETSTTYSFSDITMPSTVCLPSLKTVANSCFRNSKGITSADFAIVSKVDNLAFYFCNGLETLILRKADAICTLSNTNALSSTKIANGTGYIYVPSALVEEYKVATNWSTYSAQIRAIEGSEYE